MFIYKVFRVISSTAPIYQGDEPSKLERVGIVRANNSKFACDAARAYHGLDNEDVLFASCIIMEQDILDASGITLDSITAVD